MNDLVRLLAEVIPLGLAAAITPTLLGLQLLVIGEATWLRRAIVVVVANALAFLLVMVIVTAGLAQLPDAGQGHSPGLDKLRFACGLILLVMSVYFLMPHRDMQAKAKSFVESRVARASSWLFFGLAFYMSISDFSSFLVLLPGLHDVTAARADQWVKAVALVVLFVLSPAPRTASHADVHPHLRLGDEQQPSPRRRDAGGHRRLLRPLGTDARRLTGACPAGPAANPLTGRRERPSLGTASS